MPHPSLTQGPFSAHWSGVLKILRGGKYRFSAILAGEVEVDVDNERVLEGKGRDVAVWIHGPAVNLEPGYRLFECRFQATDKSARLQLFWEPPDFIAEPIPFRRFGRLTNDQPVNDDEWIEVGRRVVDAHNCVACHDDEGMLQLFRRRGPDLTAIDTRVFAGWLDRWLADPRRHRTDATMPRLFAATPRGRAERTAVAYFLTSQSTPLGPQRDVVPADELARRVANGERLFISVGCAACHQDGAGARMLLLPDLSTKTTVKALAEYLIHPQRHHRDSLMPALALSDAEARDLAQYLAPQAPPAEAVRLNAEDLSQARALLGDEDLERAGRQLVEAKRCTACHNLVVRGVEIPARAAPPWSKLAAQAIGCLSPDSTDASPDFYFSEVEREAVVAFLCNRPMGSREPPAPLYAARQMLERLRCLACHTCFDEGGLSPTTLERMRQFVTTNDREFTHPPPLHEAGLKLRRDPLRSVLLDGRRVRPWSSLRMPQFAPGHVEPLVDALPRLVGSEPITQIHVVPYQSQDVEDGRYLISRRAFGCLKCHAFAGVRRESGGTPGPDLAEMQARLDYDWFRRWMLDPQRIDPTTTMPASFAGGRSPILAVCDGDATKQIDAIWSYLSLGATAPLPEANVEPNELVIKVGERPELVRTFLPDMGPWSIAIGYPEQISLAFDAKRCRLAYAWTGEFLDVGPAWTGRGGQPAKLLGKRFWTGPDGFPWTFTESGAAPEDFPTLFADPMLGAPLPDGAVPYASPRLRFLGYDLGRSGSATFRISYRDVKDRAVEISMTPGALRVSAAAGVVCDYSLRQFDEALSVGWLYIGRSESYPQRVSGAPAIPVLPAEPKTSRHLVDASEPLVLHLGGGTRVVRTTARGAWHITRRPSGWVILLRVSVRENSSFRIVEWVPHRDDQQMIGEAVEAEITALHRPR
jgi:mono/diheme cytochrome c family protein